MRFFTVPNAKAARSSVVYAMFIIGFFYLLTTVIGFGARAILGQKGVEAAGNGGNLAAPNLAQELGGGAGTTGGDLFLAIIAGVAFATILAVVAGLVLSASSAVAHDVWSSIIRKGKDSEREEVLVAKIAALAIGAVAMLIAILGGEGLNVSFMVGLAFAIAASANFPALLLALTWPRFNTAGAVTGVLFGVVTALGLIIISPIVWGGPPGAPDTGAFTWYDLNNPGIISIPMGFLGCYLGTVLSKERGQRALLPRAARAVGDRPRLGAGAGRALNEKRKGTMADTTSLESRLEELLEQEKFPPPDGFREQAVVSDESIYDEADKDYEGFWEKQAEALDWEQKWDQVLDWSDPPNAKWFVGGKLNVAHNCVDRHVEAGNGDRVAFHWRGEEGEERDITYADLHRDVQKFANALKDLASSRATSSGSSCR